MVFKCIVNHLVCCLHMGYLHSVERARAHVTLLTYSRVLGMGLTLTLTPLSSFVERGMRVPGSQALALTSLCRLWLGGK